MGAVRQLPDVHVDSVSDRTFLMHKIERRLRVELEIPVFHDEQHGTTIVVLAALLNALRVVGKRPEDARAVVVGAGAAGVACTDIMLAQGISDIVVCDRKGALHRATSGSRPPSADTVAAVATGVARRRHGFAAEVEG